MRTLAYLALCGLILAVAGTAGAVSYTLEDLNSSATIDTSTGMTSWVVDNQSQLFAQNFYFRIGDSPTAGVTNLAALPLTFSRAADVNINPGNEVLAVQYDGAGLDAKLGYTLTGFGPGSFKSDIGETITITNTSDRQISLHFYQYVDLDLGGTFADDTAYIVDGRIAEQSDPFWTVSETVVTPPPSRYQVDYYNGLEPPFSGDLNDNAGPITGDATWIFQWDATLGTGQSLAISKDKMISPVPEPVTMLGLFASIGGVGAYIRKRVQA
jgi:hypothetical protein